MSMSVYWSASMEALADGVLESWRQTMAGGGAPFAKFCVVIGDRAQERWLKRHFLLTRRMPQVLLNLNFVELPEFANDWLAAQVRGVNPRDRRAALHPYSREVLAWRIYNLLLSPTLAADFPELAEYIGEGDPAPARRRELAAQLARLYDEYLNARCDLLRRWEQPVCPDPGWQARLYHRLWELNPQSYAADYAAALQPGATAEPGQAFAAGFPQYAAVHIFDIPFIPEPTLRLLERIAEALPVTFWTYNPTGDWLGEGPTKQDDRREAVRAIVRAQRNALHGGGIPQALDAIAGGVQPDERLLGALAAGGRALLWAQLDDTGGGVETIGAPDPIRRLATIPVAVHAAYSPRRELEALRDGIRHYLESHPDSSPQDVLVLCADWEHYSPLVEAVFNGAPEGAAPAPDDATAGGLPVVVDGARPVDAPIAAAFAQILEFRRNRFEASAVLQLLEVPALCRRFKVDEETAETIQELVEAANIHWGYDDADVARILGGDPARPKGWTEVPHTWRRGVERLAADMLYGDEPGDEPAAAIPGLDPMLCHCGKVEADRATAAGILATLVDRLNGLRRQLRDGTPRPAAQWRDMLLAVLDDFLDLSDDEVDEASAVRRAITGVAEAIAAAGMAEVPLEGELFAAAVQEGIGQRRVSSRSQRAAVTFAPLNCSTAMPSRLIWVCGLNDGVFPRIQYHNSFDLLGRHPSIFEISSRDRDCYALLKAALGAQDELAFSHVGRDVRTGDALEAAVPLNDILDFLRESGHPATRYEHPLHAFSPAYFTPGQREALPPSYSTVDFQVATALQDHAAAAPAAAVSPFLPGPDGVTHIEAEALAEYLARPDRFLTRQYLNLQRHYFSQPVDDECMQTTLDRRLRERLRELGGLDEGRLARLAVQAVEQGQATDLESAEAAIQAAMTMECAWRPLRFGKDYKCYSFQRADGTVWTVQEAYRECCAAMPAGQVEALELPVQLPDVGETRPVRLTYRHRAALLPNQGEVQECVLLLDEGGIIYDSTRMAAWARHVAGHAAGHRFVTAMGCTGKDQPLRCYMPLERQKAVQLLVGLVAVALQGKAAELDRDNGDPMQWQEFAPLLAGAKGSYIVSTAKETKR